MRAHFLCVIRQYSFEPPDWTNVSEEAKDLVRRMLTYDSSRRISAEEALAHPWIVKFSAQKDADMSKNALTGALGNMKKFQCVFPFPSSTTSTLCET